MFSIKSKTNHLTDPAAENFYYPVSGDVRDLISVDDVTDALALGPNGLILSLTFTPAHVLVLWSIAWSILRHI